MRWSDGAVNSAMGDWARRKRNVSVLLMDHEGKQAQERHIRTDEHPHQIIIIVLTLNFLLLVLVLY